LVHFLEKSGATPVYDTSDATGFRWSLRDGGTVVGPVPFDGSPTGIINDYTSDYFLLESVRDPVRGSLSYVVYGFLITGTRAGEWWLENHVLPNLSSQTQRWYVYYWNDTDGVPGPSVDDTWTPIASGS
jgi:hypothetical protein